MACLAAPATSLESRSSSSNVIRNDCAISFTAESVRSRMLRLTTQYVTEASSTSAHARKSEYHSVSRTRTESNIGFPASGPAPHPSGRRWVLITGVGLRRRHAEQITRPAPGVQQRNSRSRVNLPAQPVHVDFDEIGKRIEGLVPDVLGDFRASDYAPGVPHQVFEQRVFLVGQPNAAARSHRRLRACVQRQVGDADLRRTKIGWPSQERAQPRQQLAKLEGLHEVIVRTAIQPRDPVLDGVPRRKHQNRRAVPFFAQIAADLKAVAARDHHVEDNHIVSVDFGLIEGIVSVGYGIHRITLLTEPLHDKTGHAWIVFHYQHTHTRIIREPGENAARYAAQ